MSLHIYIQVHMYIKVIYMYIFIGKYVLKAMEAMHWYVNVYAYISVHIRKAEWKTTLSIKYNSEEYVNMYGYIFHTDNHTQK